jgi:UDP-glucose 4-epimerase
MDTTGQDVGESRRVVITGGAGFIGGHMAELLLARGDEVVAIDNLSTGCVDNVAAVLDHPRFTLVEGDVLDGPVLRDVTEGADVIVHLAAAVGVQLIVDDPMHTIRTNIRGTEVVLDAAAEVGAKVMIASTSEVYGKAPVPSAEGDDVVLGATRNHRWAYAASKMVDEFLGLAYNTQLGLPVVVFRLFNTVGPRQTGRYGMVVPRFVRAAVQGEPIPVHGDGEQSRCFLHARDAVDAIIRLSHRPDAVGEVFNIGQTESVTILELAERVNAAVRERGGPGGPIVFVPYEEAFGPGFEDMRRRMPDTTKVRELTGWRAQCTLDDILSDVIDREMRFEGVVAQAG